MKNYNMNYKMKIFYYDEEESVEEFELFKHNVYEGNEILSMEEEIS